MALQGDLNSFALPDVLRLLAGTGKSGRLDVEGAAGTGALLLEGGLVFGGSVTTAPHAESPADVLFELLRFDEGAFAFDEGDQGHGEGSDVESIIAEAESLVAEWAEVEAVVPSMEAWVTFQPELPGEHVKISAAQWQLLAAIGSGGSVRDLANSFGLTDLVACRAVKELAEGELIAVRATHGYQPPAVELDGFERFGDEAIDDDGLGDELVEPITDLEDLVVEDRPVVMEDRDDALLPEPLPGEGVAYEGEMITGVVDGPSFDAFDDAPASPGPYAEATVGGTEAGGVDPFSETAPAAGYDSGTFAEAEPSTDAQAFAEVVRAGTDHDRSPELTAPADLQASDFAAEDLPSAGEGGDDDSERGSLLRFLSTVKP